MLGTDIMSVGRSPAYIPDQPSCLKIENNVRNVPLVVCGVDLIVDVVSTGIEHSIKPLFSTSVPHPRHGSTPLILLRLLREKLLYDMGFTPDDCCRILTTSNGVTANAVMIEPTEPDRILGMRGEPSLVDGCSTASSATLLFLLIVGM